MNKISIILPTYNRAPYLTPSIKSVLNQTWDGDLEMIVVDDCSNDNTEEVIAALDDARVSYIKSRKRTGAASARNTGVRASTGEWIAFVDSDTIWYPEKLAKQVTAISDASNDYALVYCRLRKQKGNDWEVHPTRVHSGAVYEQLLFDNFIDTPSVLMKRKAFEAVGGFDARLPRFQDWDLFLRVAQQGEVLGMEEVLFDSLTLAGAISSNHNARLEALLIIHSKYLNDISKNSELTSRFLAKIVNAYLIVDEPRKAAAFLKTHSCGGTFTLSSLVKIGHLLPKGFYRKLWDLLR
ncbi:MAG: glycosyltransferase family 2 protein [Pigmentiphaga sp.]|uniref:glycosyltransferase family 2 protein n=1 Tax=Pigmentiphaga sp. TaxID=1977564 RepID=UPI0029A6AB5A|nr:glycosyltransferase family 2 protein [Pigmentiphaga sp.]MDX3906472.1 glycosyltransferase family 2 protein [Pigmentiphaga sp.]